MTILATKRCCVRCVSEPLDGAEQPLAIDPAHRQDRAELDDDVEQLALRPFEAEQPVGEDQMAGRGDRQEFGQSLDDAENDRGNKKGGEHDLNGAADNRQRLPIWRGVADPDCGVKAVLRRSRLVALCCQSGPPLGQQRGGGEQRSR